MSGAYYIFRANKEEYAFTRSQLREYLPQLHTCGLLEFTISRSSTASGRRLGNKREFLLRRDDKHTAIYQLSVNKQVHRIGNINEIVDSIMCSLQCALEDAHEVCEEFILLMHSQDQLNSAAVLIGHPLFDPNVQEGEIFTVTVETRHMSILRILLKLPVDPTALQNALIAAIGLHDMAMIKLLVAHGAHIKSPRIIALTSKHLHIKNYLDTIA